MNSHQPHHARPPTIATAAIAKGWEIRIFAGASALLPPDAALAGSTDGTGIGVAGARRATNPNFTNSQTPMPNPIAAPIGPMLKNAPIAVPPSGPGPAHATIRHARPHHPAELPITPERKPRTICMT